MNTLPIIDGRESDQALASILAERSRPPAGMPKGNDPLVVLRRAWVEFEMGRRLITEYHEIVGEVIDQLTAAARSAS